MTIYKPPSNRSFGTNDQLIFFFLQLTQLWGEMPFCPLDYYKRRESSGQLIPDGVGLVFVVAAALSRQPWLYPDVQVSGADLKHRQHCALTWLAIRNGLRIMAQLAGDTYLYVQAWAIREAMSVVRQVHDGGRFKLAGDDITGDRHVPLVAAYFIVDAHYRSVRKTRDQRRQQKKEQAGKVPGTVAKKKKKPSRSAQVRADFHELFLRLLQSAPPMADAPAADATAARRPEAEEVAKAVQVLAALPPEEREKVARLLR